MVKQPNERLPLRPKPVSRKFGWKKEREKKTKHCQSNANFVDVVCCLLMLLLFVVIVVCCCLALLIELLLIELLFGVVDRVVVWCCYL